MRTTKVAKDIKRRQKFQGYFVPFGNFVVMSLNIRARYRLFQREERERARTGGVRAFRRPGPYPAKTSIRFSAR